jgi:hypothetical protein
MRHFFMKRYYVVTQLPPQLLCERVVKTSDGYVLYEYDPKRGVFADDGFVKNIEELEFRIRARYGFHKSVHLAESFEEVAKMFDAPLPRIIHLSRAQEFCVREGDVLFSVKWDYADGNLFFKKFEWFLGGEEPGTVAEALEKLNEYAEKRDVWILLRELIKQATAYEVRPIP